MFVLIWFVRLACPLGGSCSNPQILVPGYGSHFRAHAEVIAAMWDMVPSTTVLKTTVPPTTTVPISQSTTNRYHNALETKPYLLSQHNCPL